ncbi:hypothetical protein C8F01DRAFT_1177508 [Mycena amicta]|nr:hypothetical protein C8F01DRAFT_1177508 [Mycena amicta]
MPRLAFALTPIAIWQFDVHAHQCSVDSPLNRRAHHTRAFGFAGARAWIITLRVSVEPDTVTRKAESSMGVRMTRRYLIG